VVAESHCKFRLRQCAASNSAVLAVGGWRGLRYRRVAESRFKFRLWNC